MINRINLILRAKNITARQFAEEIGIQPSGMSHILGGRNNPSLDFVLKVIRRYPEIDANWLLLGKGEMYAADGATRVPSPAAEPSPATAVADEALSPAAPMPYAPSLFDDEASPISDNAVDEPLAERQEEPPLAHQQPSRVAEPEARYAPTYMAVPPEPTVPSGGEEAPRLVRMLLIYSDNTFAEYTPRQV